ncbi:cobalt-precorrin 5A hydrolase [Anaerosinus massiliensis]|uniref:cobalt-precorrin 5A hydrolase n=1 Tax=Massilibacillus massiliensis TaxID=1806837 RepID=UPI000AAAFD47|nr:cobalt-precorrin 5A hydrolase [Massilibacillus massiliensis]
MRLAIIAVTERGANLAHTIKQYFPADIFVKAGRNPLKTAKEYDSLRHLISEIFQKYEAFIFIMATGIVVRVIAPLIISKTVDPAVLVLNETGEHVISLLSGHIGGANDLTHLVAEKINAVPVITTATDVNKKIAADSLAKKLNLMIEPFDQLKYINAEIAQGEKFEVFLDPALKNLNYYKNELQKLCITFQQKELHKRLEELDHVALIITNQTLNLKQNQILLKPRKLSVGIGCRKNTSKKEILEAIHIACSMIHVPIEDITNMASTIVKNQETGLLETAKELAVPIIFYENSQLQEVIDQYRLDISKFVNEQIGVGNVCEAAALLISQSKKMILNKTRFKKVTVAIAWAK